MSIPIDRVCQFLAAAAPLKLAEDWDNVGLLFGDRSASAKRLMTCLTITPDVVDEAIERNVDLIIAHHPLPFRPLPRLTTDQIPGQMLWRLAGHQIAVYSAHTAYDSALDGINAQWCSRLNLVDVRPLTPASPDTNANARGDRETNDESSETVLGSGRCGRLPETKTLFGLIAEIAKTIPTGDLRFVGKPDRPIQKVAFGCGSGGSFLSPAIRLGCEVLVTGEATFHTLLEARSRDTAMILVGHYHSERFAMERLADRIDQWASDEKLSLECFASQLECDPVQRWNAGI